MDRIHFRAAIIGSVLIALLFSSRLSHTQELAGSNRRIGPAAIRQIEALVQEKRSRTSAQKKVDSRLLAQAKIQRGERVAEGVPTLETGVNVDQNGFVEVEITARITTRLVSELKRIGAEVLALVPKLRSVTARVPIGEVEGLANLKEVIFIMPRQEVMLNDRIEPQFLFPTGPAFTFDRAAPFGGLANFTERAQRVREFFSSTVESDVLPETGSVNSQADTTHGANTFRSTTGFTGAGVKVGVISDGVDSLAARQASGDLPSVTVIAGQAGTGDEGTAMLELIHDLAPGAQLYYATSKPSAAQFATNIRALRTAGCTIIIDDVSYSGETAFQHGQAANVPSNTNGGVIVQAVNDVTVGSQAGALYFSSAGNSGNKNDGTSGVWEGDFVDFGAAGGILAGTGNWHSFGQFTGNILTAGASGPIVLQWSDPLGGSANDYDLYVIDPSGTVIVSASTNNQAGAQDPVEAAPPAANVAGNIIAIVKFSGAGRFLHLNTNRGKLTTSTSGVVFGHNAAQNTISVAATPAGPTVFGSPGSPTGPFPSLHSSTNKVEVFSSDGPRRIFFNADSSAITPGNFSSTGGQLLQKPDITAADGTSTTTPGFIPFFGTSAAAPHAGALAALLRSACTSSTNAQLIAAMKSTAIDIESAGVDRDAGSGIFMPIPAKAALCSTTTTRKLFDFDGDNKADISVFRPTSGDWYRLNSGNGSFAGMHYGANGDRSVPADYDGDGKTDVAIYRPSTGSWYVLRSATNVTTGVAFGVSTDLPVPADYDGDGKADTAVYRPSTGTWYRINSSNGQFVGVVFGLATDKPAPADFDGDGKADVCVFRPSSGDWYRLNSSTGGLVSVHFGANGDKATPADFDGDGKADISIFRPATGDWYRLNSSNGALGTFRFGQNGDLPAPADFDGDGKADHAVFRPSAGTWYIQRSTSGFLGQSFGANGDTPSPGSFVY